MKTIQRDSDPRVVVAGLAVGAVFSIVFALLFLYLAVDVGRERLRLAREGRVATGRVIRIEQQQGRGRGVGGPTYAPVIRFTTGTGRAVEFRALGGSEPGFEVGDTMEVFYDPDEPEGACVRSVFQTWAAPAGLGFMGTLFSGCAIVMAAFAAGEARRLGMGPR